METIPYNFTSCKYSQSRETENKYIKSKRETVTELVNIASEGPPWALDYTHRNCKWTIILKYVCVCVCVQNGSLNVVSLPYLYIICGEQNLPI